jgi:AbrB family looped-hinge helix DNA binding protein
MPRATVTSKGQVTIPRSIRQALKVGAGDRLDFVLEAENRVVVRPAVRDVAEIKGLLHRAGRKPVSIEEMNAAISRQGRRGR